MLNDHKKQRTIHQLSKAVFMVRSTMWSYFYLSVAQVQAFFVRAPASFAAPSVFCPLPHGAFCPVVPFPFLGDSVSPPLVGIWPPLFGTQAHQL